jgi:very-short-patch-repair endonuclease
MLLHFLMGTDFYNRNMFYGADSKTIRAAAMLRKNMTLAELILWKKLKDREVFHAKFRRQHPIDIFIVDFYCHECKLVIEVDGEIHYDKETIEYDLGRTAELNKHGLKVIRFTNEQVISNIDLVIIQIQSVLRVLAPL